MYDWIKTVFDAPSRRRDVDYSKDISVEAKNAVLLIFRDYLSSDGPFSYASIVKATWMGEVVREMGHLHHSFANADQKDGFSSICGFLDGEPSTAAFLDILEISLRNSRAPNIDNDFVDTVNIILEEYDSPYLLSRYVRREEIAETNSYGEQTVITHFDAFPRAYLRHETVVQKEAIEPALEIFSDPAYATPADDFRTALDRHKSSDYDGCVTACAAAVEGTIKVVAGKNKWNVKGNGLDTVAQSFISKSSLPDTVRTSFRPLSDWRNTTADAHGHASKDETTESLARHFIALSASLIVLVQSEEK